MRQNNKLKQSLVGLLLGTAVGDALGLPAGMGLATARACLKLCLGISPERSGVCSAGNGPAMRSPIIGAYFADNKPLRQEFVRTSTQITHTDPRAETAALAVAEAAAWSARGLEPSNLFLERLPACGEGQEWLHICNSLSQAMNANLSVEAFARSLGLAKGVTGYAFHTVPVALYAWLRHPGDFRGALVSALDCGGDTDTVGAIVGSLAGAQVGEPGIPSEWLNAICQWPRTQNVLRQLACRLAQTKEQPHRLSPISYFWPGLLPRNLTLLLVVLTHGFRRLFPPYG
jgi:ADP-ribosyl-[dinitrogen reductase] hydrolase